MFKALKQWLDDWAMNLAAKSLGEWPVPPGAIPQAEGILGQPGFLSVNDVRVPKLQFLDKINFTFPSHRPVSAATNNNLARGKLFAARSATGTVLLVHGWNAEYHYILGFPRLARHLNNAGLNALMIELPFHCQRRPRIEGVPRNFISEDVPLMLRLVDQSLADFQAALLWAREQAQMPLGIWGFSLGGLLAGLFCTVSSMPKAAVLTTPVVRMDLAVEQLQFCQPIRRTLKAGALDLSILNLDRRTPKVPANSILLVASTYDRFVPHESVTALAEAWDGCEHLQVPQGHISILLSRKNCRETAHWLRKKLT